MRLLCSATFGSFCVNQQLPLRDKETRLINLPCSLFATFASNVFVFCNLNCDGFEGDFGGGRFGVSGAKPFVPLFV